MKRVSKSMGNRLAKLFHEKSTHRNGINGDDYVLIPNLEYWDEVVITAIKAEAWTGGFIKEINMELLAWANRTGETKYPESQIMILTEWVVSAESSRIIYKTDKYGKRIQEGPASKV